MHKVYIFQLPYHDNGDYVCDINHDWNEKIRVTSGTLGTKTLYCHVHLK